MELTEIGHTLMQRLPLELRDCRESHSLSQSSIASPACYPKLKRNAIDFHAFANQTQKLFRKSSTPYSKPLAEGHSESKRKLLLHHESWQSEQKLISHKLEELQVRRQQEKFSEYDWRGVGEGLRKCSREILGNVERNVESREVRNRGRLRRLLVRKYPGRGQ